MCTGLEGLLVSAGASAGTAAAISTGVSVLGGLATVKSLTDKPKMPDVQTITAADKPQAAKGPERTAINAQNSALVAAAGAKAGNAGTFLTGPLGIEPSTLNLGRNTLLGQ